MKSFFIIGGTFKSGTSALFTYLNQVPGIQGSKKKETGFFVPARYDKPVPSIDKYFQFFNCDTEEILMEASPGYLYGKEKIAKSIKDNLGSNIKMLFILRNPIDRFISFYNMLANGFINDINNDVFNTETSLEEFFKKCKDYNPSEPHPNEKIDYLLNGLLDGCYVDYLPSWYSVYEKKDLKVCFFDNLDQNARNLCADILEWLGYDNADLSKMNFRIVNKARVHNNEVFRKIASSMNMKFENFLRRNENLKLFLIKLYDMLNSSSEAENNRLTNSNVYKQIQDYYQPHNHRLRLFLEKIGYENFPEWLNDH